MGGGGKGGSSASENPYSAKQAEIAGELWRTGSPFRESFSQDYLKFLGLEKKVTPGAGEWPTGGDGLFGRMVSNLPPPDKVEYIPTGKGGELPSYIINPALEESGAYASRDREAVLASGASGGNLLSELASIERNRSNRDVAVTDDLRQKMRSEVLNLAFGQAPGIANMLSGPSAAWANQAAAKDSAGAAGWQTAAGLAGNVALAVALK